MVARPRDEAASVTDAEWEAECARWATLSERFSEQSQSVGLPAVVPSESKYPAFFPELLDVGFLVDDEERLPEERDE